MKMSVAFIPLIWMAAILSSPLPAQPADESHQSTAEIYAQDDAQQRRPAAWNMELGYALTENWQVALRYGGSRDGDAGAGEFLPKNQYGAVLNRQLFENTGLALEYLRSEFRNDFQTVDAIVAQLAIEF